MQLDTVKKSDIGADGKVRRKYDIGDEPEKGKIPNISIGAIIASALLVLKNVAFGPETADGRAEDLSEIDKEEDLSQVAAKNEDKKLARLSRRKDRDERTGEKEQESFLSDPASSNREKSLDLNSKFDNNPVEQRFTEYPVAKNTGPANGGPPSDEAASNILTFPGSKVANPSVAAKTGAVASREGVEAGNGQNNQNTQDDERGEDSQSPDQRQNRLPVVSGPVYLDNLYLNQTMLLATGLLLAGASDADADPLEIQNLVSSSGTLQDNFNGTWTFVPDAFDTTVVSFNYDISDGQGSVRQTAFIDLLELPGTDYFGTEQQDQIQGSSGSDRINSGAGNDIIISRENSDIVDAGAGDDRIIAGAGDDVIYGRAGNDIIFGGTGNDLLVGGDGDDILDGQEGNDTLLGEQGNDILIGGSGDDRGFGGSQDDQLFGNSGNDLMDGGAGSDIIDGGDNDDILIGGLGADIANGGTGDDTIIALAADGDDIYDGGAGQDTYDLSGTSADAVIDLTSNRASSNDLGNDVINNFENIIAGTGNDLIIANAETNSLFGNGGDDTFVFLSGNNSGPGGWGRDRIEDFEVGDTIDVRMFDGDTEEEGLQALVFRYDDAIFDGVGQVLYRYEDRENGEVTLLQFNIDRDEEGSVEVDYEIEIVGRHELGDHNLLT